MSGLIFIIAVDWVVSRATKDGRRGIRWTPFSQLEDLDYADDIALVSHTAKQIQQKTDKISEYWGADRPEGEQQKDKTDDS